MKKIVIYILSFFAFALPIFGNSIWNVHADIATFFWYYSQDLKYISCYIDDKQNIKCKKSSIWWGAEPDSIEDIEISKFQWKKYLWLEDWRIQNGWYDWLCGIQATGRLDCIWWLDWIQDWYNLLTNTHGMIKSISISKIWRFEICAVFYDGFMSCMSGSWSVITNNSIPILYWDRIWQSVVVYNNFACAIDSESDIHCFWKISDPDNLLEKYKAKRFISYKQYNRYSYNHWPYWNIFCFIDIQDHVICLNTYYWSNSNTIEFFQKIDDDQYIDFYKYSNNNGNYCVISVSRFLSCSWTNKSVFWSAKEIIFISDFTTTNYGYVVFIHTNNFINNDYYYHYSSSAINKHDIYLNWEPPKTFHPQFSYIVDTQEKCDMYNILDKNISLLKHHSINHNILYPGNNRVEITRFTDETKGKITEITFKKESKLELFNKFNSWYFQLGEDFQNINDVWYYEDNYSSGLEFEIKSWIFDFGYRPLFSYTLSEKIKNELDGFFISVDSDAFLQWANEIFFIYIKDKNSWELKLLWEETEGITWKPKYSWSQRILWNRYYDFKKIKERIEKQFWDIDYDTLYFSMPIPIIFNTNIIIKWVDFLYFDSYKESKLCIYYDIAPEEYEHITINQDTGKIEYSNGKISGEVVFDNSTNEYCVWDNEKWCIWKIKTDEKYWQDGKPIKKPEYETITWTWWGWWDWWNWWDGDFWFWRPDESTIYGKIIGKHQDTIASVWNLLNISIPLNADLEGEIPIPTLTEDFKIWLINSTFMLQPPRDVLNVSDIDITQNIWSKKFITFLLGLLYIACRIMIIWILLFWLFLFWKAVNLFFSSIFWDTLSSRWWLSNVWWVLVYAVVIVLVLIFISGFLTIISPATTFLNSVLDFINLFFTYITSTLLSYNFFVGMVNGFFIVFTGLMWPLLTWRLYMKFWRLWAW